MPYVALDGIYEKSRNFETLNRNLAKAVLAESRQGDVVYCVEGSPAEDRSAGLICGRTKAVQVIEGVSKGSAAFAAAGVVACGATAFSAYEIERYRRPSLPLAVYDLDSRLTASEVKLHLGALIGDEERVTFVHGGTANSIFLYELDRQTDYDYSTAVVIEDRSVLEKKRFDYVDLEEIVKRLRAPDGCPWDRAQTNASIRMNLIEEAYELVDAIDAEDDAKICEETGDVLLQACFHAVMKEEQGAFTSTDAITELCKKLIFRHSHVFGKDKAGNAEEALSSWDKNKTIEKHQVTHSDSVRDVPKCFPALLRAQKVGKRAAKGGFDFSSPEQCLDKVREELAEFLQAYRSEGADRAQEEFGDLLFAAVNLGRKTGMDCEMALKEATQKFIDRFCAAEAMILQDGKQMEELSEGELDAYWERVKHADKAD